MADFSHTGLSIYLVFGATYGGFGIGFDRGFRIVLGWVGFGIVGVDIETLLAKVMATMKLMSKGEA